MRVRVVLVSVVAVAVVAVAVWFAWSRSEPVVPAGPATMRMITTEQYANTIRYLFGEDIDLSSSRFPLLPRKDGLVALGATAAAMTPSTLDMFHRAARSIAAQVVDTAHRSLLLPCRPDSIATADDRCAREFLSRTGRILFRRPLDSGELDTYVGIAGRAAVDRHDFYEGVAYALAGMMTSPKFIFITDSKAARLSLFLWDALPDDELLSATQSGALDDARGLRAQVDRMLASPRLEQGMRALFSDLLRFQDFESVTKDAVIYPAFTFEASRAVHEQTLRMMVDHLLVRQGDYRELFTTNRIFVNRALGLIYGTSVPVEAAGDEWIAQRVSDSRSAGVLTAVSFLAAHSHPGRSSPTQRGKALRESFLCQKVPDPPPTVDFSVFENLAGKLTARARLQAHAVNPACKGCHLLTDPVGLAFENFDGAGQFRVSEHGAAIDTRSQFDGQPIADISELGRAIAADPALTACFTRRLFAYAVGHDPGTAEQEWLIWMEGRFAAHGYRLKEFLQEMTASKAFSEVGK